MAINKVDLDQLLVQAKVSLIGASDAGLRGALYDVMSEFLNDSSTWTQDIAIVTQADVISYPLFVTEGQILRLVGVTNWADVYPDPTAANPVVAFESALMPDVGTLILQNAPNTVSNLLVTVVTNVKQPVGKDLIPQGPDWLLPIWHVGLLDGLLGKMMIQPSKSYSSEKMGVYHLKRFRDAISRARVSKLRANTHGAQAWRFPQSFRVMSSRGSERSFG